MKNHHNAIRNWNNMKNNAIPSESKIKTVFKPTVEETTTTSTTTSTTTETTTIPEDVKLEQPVIVKESTTTSTTTQANKTRLPNITNKK